MIISHQHRFVFFAVPKTATHTIRQGLNSHLVSGDWQQQQLFGRDTLPVDALARVAHGHLTFRELQEHMPSDQWLEYHKFAFVRNPFDRFVSTCAFLNRGNPEFKKDAICWMKRALSRPRFQQRVLVRPQFEMLCDQENLLGMDWVGRYESLQFSFERLCQRLGLATTMLAVSNASRHQSYSSYYDEELYEQVKDFYAQDFLEFAYSTEFPE